MYSNLKKIAIHPIFIFIIISFLECIPTDKQLVYNVMPKEGDNFKTGKSNNVFCFLNKGKYLYKSEECYFNNGNPAYSASYKEGGIMIVTDEIADKIPLKGVMCDDNVMINRKKEKLSFIQKYLNVSFFLGYFSGIAHVVFYILLSFSIVFHFSSNKKKFYFAFFGGVLGGSVLEVIQHFFIEGRSASVEDILLNTLGTILGLVSFWLIKRYSLFLKTNI